MKCSFAVPTFFLFLSFLAVSIQAETTHSFEEQPVREFKEEPFNQPEKNRNDPITDSRITVDFGCIGCKIGMGLLLELHKKGSEPNALLKAATFLCGATGNELKPLCRGFVNSVGRGLLAIFDRDNGTIMAADVCGMLLGGTCQMASQRLNSWKLNIPDLNHEPPTSAPSWPRSSPRTQKILHLSDLHVQLSYTPGSNANCGFPQCCDPSLLRQYTREEARKLAFIPANKYGEYNCDLPVPTLDLILAEISRKHPDIDYIFMTGDFAAHDTWKQNRGEILESAKKVVDLVSLHFPSTPVFPAIGNHDSFPINMFPDSRTSGKYNPSWLYQRLAEMYLHWLPDQQQQKSLRDSGYYSVVLRPGLRVLSINSNFCNNFNFWLLLDLDDPHKHLHWLYRQLHKAELMKEKVFILGHTPPGSPNCLIQWSGEYGRLVHRFRNTIAGQFYGHNHTDEFEIFFGHPNAGESRREAVNMVYIAPSQTPIDGVNPAYRIYTIDGDHENTTNLPMNHETYWMNLTETQLTSEVRFQLEYKALEDLKLEDMSPNQWHQYVLRMVEDEDLFKSYRSHYARFGPFVSGSCDHECKIRMLCNLVTANSKGMVVRNEECLEIRKNLYKNRVNQFWWEHLFER